MRLLLILIFLTYVNAKFGRSYRSSDTEVLPVPVKNVSSTTVDTIVMSLSPVSPSTTTTLEPIGNVSKPEPTPTNASQLNTENVHKKTEHPKINTLKHTMERHQEKHAKNVDQHDKVKKNEGKPGTELGDVSEEQTYDDIEERVEKELAEQYKDEDDYSSAEHQRTSSLTTQEPTTTLAPVTTINFSTSAPTSTSASPSTVATSALTSKVTTAASPATPATSGTKLRTTGPKISRRNNDGIQISVSMHTIQYSDDVTDATLGKMDIGRRKTTRLPKTNYNTQKMTSEVAPQKEMAPPNEIAQPQKLSGIKNISDYQPRRIYETTTKRVIEILRTLKYRKNSAPGTMHNLENNLEKVLILCLSFSIVAYAV